MKVSKELLEALKSENGGYTRETIEGLGVPWPPPKGWKRRLLKGWVVRERKKKKRTKRKQWKARSSNFYKTEDWKKLRYVALSMNDGRCELCGASKQDGASLQVDHIKPIRTHPHLGLELSNLQVLCGSCNWGKGSRSSEDWREPRLKVLMGERIP